MGDAVSVLISFLFSLVVADVLPSIPRHCLWVTLRIFCDAIFVSMLTLFILQPQLQGTRCSTIRWRWRCIRYRGMYSLLRPYSFSFPHNDHPGRMRTSFPTFCTPPPPTPRNPNTAHYLDALGLGTPSTWPSPPTNISAYPAGTPSSKTRVLRCARSNLTDPVGMICAVPWKSCVRSLKGLRVLARR